MLSEEIETLIGDYWELAYEEGRLQGSSGDKANEVLHKLRRAIEAAVLAELAKQEPVAYTYDLATEKVKGVYQGWFKHISEYKPNVPEDSIRNLTPLYLHPAPTPEGMTEAQSAAYDKIDRFLRNNLDDSEYAEYSAAMETMIAAAENETRK